MVSKSSWVGKHVDGASDARETRGGAREVRVRSATHAARRARVSHVPRFGRSSILEDQAAIEFSLGFYNALGRGLDAGGGKVGTS